jgi:hypothetical protein
MFSGSLFVPLAIVLSVFCVMFSGSLFVRLAIVLSVFCVIPLNITQKTDNTMAKGTNNDPLNITQKTDNTMAINSDSYEDSKSWRGEGHSLFP